MRSTNVLKSSYVQEKSLPDVRNWRSDVSSGTLGKKEGIFLALLSKLLGRGENYSTAEGIFWRLVHSVDIHKASDILFSPVWINSENKNLDIKNTEAVMRFRSKYPQVNLLVSRAETSIRKYFPHSNLLLELAIDHDSDNQVDELFIRIQTAKKIDEALKLLEKVDREVFDPAMADDELLLNISVDPLPES